MEEGTFAVKKYKKIREVELLFLDIPYPLPDKIILFQKNIENICSTEKELIEQIQKTLIHEVGHYFGLSERELRKYEG